VFNGADPLPVASRPYVQMFMDGVWFSMVWHYPLVAGSRLVAIKWPMKFKHMKPLHVSRAYNIGLFTRKLQWRARCRT
jgi:hypothetical protein